MIHIQALAEVPPYHVSKWLKLPLYLSLSEMKSFLTLLPSPFVPVSGVIAKDQLQFDKNVLLEMYGDYTKALQQGKRRPEVDKRLHFVVTEDLNSLRAIDVEKGMLIRVIKPVIQVQPYTLNYSVVSEEFHELTFSPDSFYWGLCFSLPQLYQHPKTNEVEKVFEAYPAIGTLFKNMQRWSREHTVPTPFEINGKIIHHPARVGKEIIQGAKCLHLPQN